MLFVRNSAARTFHVRLAYMKNERFGYKIIYTCIILVLKQLQHDLEETKDIYVICRLGGPYSEKLS